MTLNPDRGLSFMIDRTFSIVKLCGIWSNLVTLWLNLQQNRHASNLEVCFSSWTITIATLWNSHNPKLYILNDLVAVALFWQAANICRKCTYDSHKQKELKTRKCTKAKRSIGLPNQPVQKRESEQVVQHLTLETVVIRTVCTAMKNTQRHVQEKYGW